MPFAGGWGRAPEAYPKAGKKRCRETEILKETRASHQYFCPPTLESEANPPSAYALIQVPRKNAALFSGEGKAGTDKSKGRRGITKHRFAADDSGPPCQRRNEWEALPPKPSGKRLRLLHLFWKLRFLSMHPAAFALLTVPDNL